MMGVLDTNTDGKLSLQEWLDYVKSVHDKNQEACKALLKLYEKQVSSAKHTLEVAVDWESKSEAERIFKLADKDGNGYIDTAELAKVRNSQHLAEVMMGVHDTNADGKLSLQEWLAYVKSIHDKNPEACKALLK